MSTSADRPRKGIAWRPKAQFPGYQLPDELVALREQIRRIVQDEIVPIEQRIDPDAPDLPDEDLRRLREKTRAAGLWCLAAPEEYGGGGLDTFSMCVLLEEMAQHRMGLYNPGAGVFGRYPPVAIWGGTREQIERYAVPALREGYYTFFAITEPSGGSDPAGAIQCRAEKRGDGWALNGTKIFISHADEAEWGVVFARTDRTRERAGISCFIVEKHAPGFRAKRFKTIRTVAEPCEVVFEDCRLPADALLGEEGKGLHLCLDLLTRNRFPYATANLGVAVAAHRMAIAHAKQRSTFGVPLAQRQAIQWMLADAEVELRACRWLIWDGAWKADRGEDARVEASIAKLYSSEVLGRAVDAAVQIHGGYGVSKEFPLERWYREARVRRIGEGPSEVQRMVIARHLLR
ncbi:MAG: acyl-CoA dehydrogenase family protein [Candidatus Rokubacteria bacterium]|nr:acyl-CoA dehydrogenase family protein [Candidatus Rokubacteria bacterium]